MRFRRLKTFRSHLPLVVAALALAACKKDVIIDQAGGEIPLTWTPAGVQSIKNVPGTAITAAINQKMAGEAPEPLPKDTWEHARRLYKNYQGVPLWLTADGLDKPRAGALMYALADGTSDGLRLDGYPLEQLGAAVDALMRTDAPTAEQLAEVDMLLTAAYVALGEDLMTGQVDPKEVNQSWYISGKEEKVDSALFRSLRAEELDRAIALMRPTDEAYDALREQLAWYRQHTEKGWTKVPAGKTLKAGQSDSPARIAALVTRLSEEGYAVGTPTPAPADSNARPATIDTAAGTPPATSAPAASSSVFSKPLSEAVSEFQRRHGMEVTGTLNAETVSALNVPPSYRATQIAANLERFRWMPRALGDRFIMVNVPAFKVAAYDSGRKSLEMKVIVGMEFEDRATPVFADSMQYVVFRPYWNVTPNIQAKEFANKSAAELAAGDYEYYKDGGATRIRQRPGPKNALGLVKFLFPNDFNIYLHDTPNDKLFEEDVRAFSHGCIRLEKPDEMAAYVLGWDIDRVHQMMNGGGDNKSITLKQKIPVYITYFTTYVTDGKLFFGNDLYKRDDKLVTEVANGAILPPDYQRAARTLHKMAEAWGGDHVDK
ncbi:MAG TPA: L,D-transpeptidase family protein [Gemmatimonadaceae bacterium]|nr:L,D-transpeptidase family protein [Gemmatimonadaceae bacterium]